MKGQRATIAVIVIVNACLWGLAMIMSSRALSGTGAYQEIQHILGGCAAGSVILVGGGLTRMVKRAKQDD